MQAHAIAVAAILAILGPVNFSVAETTEISLADTWGCATPGTIPLNNPPGASKGQKEEVLQLLREWVMFLSRERDKPIGPCFVVEGEGVPAFENSLKVLKGEEVEHHEGAHRSLVFYTGIRGGTYAYLRSITVDGETLRLKYEIVYHSTHDGSYHIVLIPLRSVGNIRHVDVQPLPYSSPEFGGAPPPTPAKAQVSGSVSLSDGVSE